MSIRESKVTFNVCFYVCPRCLAELQYAGLSMFVSLGELGTGSSGPLAGYLSMFVSLLYGKVYTAIKGHMIIFPAFNVCFPVTKTLREHLKLPLSMFVSLQWL